MRIPILLLPLLLAAPTLAAQGTAPEPRLLRVAASSGGVVLSLDSAGIARTGDSTFVVDAVYQFPADTAQQVAADRQVETQEMDCGRTRLRDRVTAMYAGADVPVPVSTDAAAPAGWQPVGDDELPIFQAICAYLLGSFAMALPVTPENGSADRPAVLVNGELVARTLERTYPRELAARGIGGTVLVRLQITAEGDVVPGSVRVVWATRAELAVPALAMAQRMRFRPARKDGRDTAVWMTMPLSFGMSRGGPPPAPRP
ncbi:MAG: energy transducer TonB [Longimicrobiaceae bacterium]